MDESESSFVVDALVRAVRRASRDVDAVGCSAGRVPRVRCAADGLHKSADSSKDALRFPDTGAISSSGPPSAMARARECGVREKLKRGENMRGPLSGCHKKQIKKSRDACDDEPSEVA